MCKKRTTVASFLSTGRLGLLGLGLTLDETLGLLGPPDGSASIEDYYEWLAGVELGSNPLCIGYGNLEVWFDQENILDYFSVHFLGTEPEPLPSVLGVDWLEFGYRMNTRSFKEYIDEHNIVCSEILFPFNQPKEFMTLVVPASNVTISFDLEGGNDQLIRIGKSDYVESRFPMQRW